VIGAVLLTDASSAQETSSDSASSSQYKIGVVDRKKVFDNHKVTQDALTELEKEKDKDQEEIDKLSAAVTEKKEAYEEDEPTLTDDAKEAREEEVQKLYREYLDRFKELEDDINRKHAKIIKKSREQIDEAVAKICSEENFHLIVEGDPKSGTSVLYYSTTIEITSKVIERLNSEDERVASGDQTAGGS
jgi:outer membrane protein